MWDETCINGFVLHNSVVYNCNISQQTNKQKKRVKNMSGPYGCLVLLQQFFVDLVYLALLIAAEITKFIKVVNSDQKK